MVLYRRMECRRKWIKNELERAHTGTASLINETLILIVNISCPTANPNNALRINWHPQSMYRSVSRIVHSWQQKVNPKSSIY